MKDSMLPCTLLLLTAAGLLCAGCSILGPLPDTSHFFTLAPLPDTVAPPGNTGTETSSTMLLGLGPIELPPYLDRHEIATRLSPTQVTYSGSDRWAEPLNVSVSRVLLQNLSHLLGTERIAMYPWSNAAKVDYQIEVELLNFEVTKEGEARLLARYGIFAGGSRRVLVAREASINHPTPVDPAASVAALSATLGELSQEIAAAIRQLPKPQGAVVPGRRKS